MNRNMQPGFGRKMREAVMMPPRVRLATSIVFPEEISSIALLVYLVLRNGAPMPSSPLSILKSRNFPCSLIV